MEACGDTHIPLDSIIDMRDFSHVVKQGDLVVDLLSVFAVQCLQIEFVDQLPKTISGKIRRVELRKREWSPKPETE